MLKADIATSSKILQQLFNNIWNNEIIPNNWTKGHIFKLRKKGDLQMCDNWRGMGFSMGQAQYITKDRGRWRHIVDALCPIGDEEDK